MGKPYREMSQRERDGRNSRRWKRTRDAVFAAYGDVCWMCGRPGADTVDHYPVSLKDGGTNEMHNLRPAHGRKTAYCPGNYGRKAPIPETRRSRAW
jgi:5-methylcytosine-specific restriction endonuclease McrA